MKFDVVCGNPPYNNDAYIDFVIKGHELSKSVSDSKQGVYQSHHSSAKLSSN